VASDPECPIQVEVNTDRRLVEHKGGVIELRLTNLSVDEPFEVDLTVDGKLLPTGWTWFHRFRPGEQVPKRVDVAVLAAANACIIRVRVDVREASGARHVFVGDFDQDVHPAVSGPSVVHYNVSAVDGSVVDASGVHIGDAAPPRRAPTQSYRVIHMRADSVGQTLMRCVIFDAVRSERIALDARRSLVFGRSGGEADVPIADSEKKLSRTHCRLVVDESGAWVEHLSTVNTTRLNGVEVSGRSPLVATGTSELLLAGVVRLRLTPIAAPSFSDRARRDLFGALRYGARGGTVGASVPGGYLIESSDTTYTMTRTLWLLSGVHIQPPVPRITEESLVFAATPHLVRTQFKASGDIESTRPVREGEQISGWLVVT
jgi:FHA domain